MSDDLRRLTDEDRERINVIITKALCGYGPDDPLWHTVDYFGALTAENEALKALAVTMREALAQVEKITRFLRTTDGRGQAARCSYLCDKALALTPSDMQCMRVVPEDLLREARELMGDHVPHEHGGDQVMAAIDDVLAKR